MKNELHRHKRSDAVKWVLILLAVLFLATAVTAAITKGFKDFNPYGWLDKFENKVENLYAVSGVSHELTDKSAELDKAGDVDREYAASNVKLKATDTVLFIIDDLPVKFTIDELSVGVDKSDANTAHDEITVTDEGTYDITLKHYKDSDAWQACFVQAATSEEPEVKSLSLSVKQRAAANTTDDGFSALSEDNACEVTATVSPANAIYSQLRWIPNFKFSSGKETGIGNWGEGKNVADYISVDVSADTHTALVTCLQPFGEIVTIRVESEEDSDIYVNFDCQYRNKIASVNVSQTSSVDLNAYPQFYIGTTDTSAHTTGDESVAVSDFEFVVLVNPEFEDIMIEYGFPVPANSAHGVKITDGFFSQTEYSTKLNVNFDETLYKALFGDDVFKYKERLISAVKSTNISPLIYQATAIELKSKRRAVSSGELRFATLGLKKYTDVESVSTSTSEITF